MKPIGVRDRTHIKQLLYGENVLGVKGDEYRSFGGFQLWWYDKHRGICDCCASGWSDGRKRVTHFSLDKAAKILWHHRRALHMRARHADEDSGIQIMEHLEDTRR